MSGRRRWWALSVALGAAVVGASALPAQSVLTLAWEGATPGAIIGHPYGVESSRGPLLLLATEDRGARLYDRRGGVVSLVETGLRRTIGILQEAPDRFLMIPALDSPRPMTRLLVAGTEVYRVGTPLPASAVLHPDAWHVVASGNDLVYSFSRSAVAQGSTVGGRLWSRPLPGAPILAFSHGDRVYAVLDDGRMLVFYGDGRGEPVFHAPEVPVAAVAVPGRRPRMLLLDETGDLSLVRSDLSAGSPGHPTEWRASGYREFQHLRLGRSGESWWVLLWSSDGTVAMVDAAGNERWRGVLSENGLRQVHHAHPWDRLVAVDGQGRAILSDLDGRVRFIQAIPEDMDRSYWVATAGQLVVWNEDWRVMVFSLTGPGGAVPPRPAAPPPAVPAPRRNRGLTSATRALADAVLAGSSREERWELLRRLDGQLDSGELFGRVGELGSVYADLAVEAYRSPLRRSQGVANDFPEIRIAAVSSLSRLGDRESRAVLAQVVRRDPVAAVAAAALDGVARFGVENGGALAAALERFQLGSNRERETLAPAMVAVLEQTGIIGADPGLAQAVATELARAAVPIELRRRAVQAFR